MEIKGTISKYVLTERVGHKVLTINIEVNHISKKYSITSYDSLRKEFGFIGTDKTEEIRVICGMIVRAAEFAEGKLREADILVDVKDGKYPLMRDVFVGDILRGIAELMDKECIIYSENSSDVSVLCLLSEKDLSKYNIFDVHQIKYIKAIMVTCGLKFHGE